MNRTILVYRWEDAPQELRDLSDSGGDEDWVVHVPKDIVFDMIPSWIEAMGVCDLQEVHRPDGSIVFIGSHA